MKILSCVPQQKYTFKDKLAWIDALAKEHKPDLFVTPQEYFGGVQQLFFNTGEPLVYSESAVLEPIVKLSKKHNMGIMVGALVNDERIRQHRERIYAVDPAAGVVGFVDKMMLPAYDHIDAKGLTRVVPESDFRKRAVAFEVMGARIGVLFCWEVYSDYIWHAIASAEPDFVVSMIKFGVQGWPSKGQDDSGNAVVKGFGYGNDGGWVERLIMASRYEVCAPIVCSTNSWDQPKRSRPLCGTIYPFDDHENTLWYPAKGERGQIEEHIVIDEFNPLEFRYMRGDKFKYNEATGDWPSGAVRARTMMWKIRRMERKFLKETSKGQGGLFG